MITRDDVDLYQAGYIQTKESVTLSYPRGRFTLYALFSYTETSCIQAVVSSNESYLIYFKLVLTC